MSLWNRVNLLRRVLYSCCPYLAAASRPTHCLQNTQFDCTGHGHCIPIEKVCDGTNDCGRFEDERVSLCIGEQPFLATLSIWDAMKLMYKFVKVELSAKYYRVRVLNLNVVST